MRGRNRRRARRRRVRELGRGLLGHLGVEGYLGGRRKVEGREAPSSVAKRIVGTGLGGGGADIVVGDGR